MKRKVIVRLQGGVGNQLFQYAAAYAAAKQYDAELILDANTGFKLDPYHRSFRLSHFNLSGKVANEEDLESIGFLSEGISRIYRKVEWILMSRYGIYHMPWLFRAQLFNPIVYDGYWQSYRYFDHHRAGLMTEFQVKKEVVMRTTDRWRSLLEEEDAVAVHVRRNNYAHVCPLEYYIAAARRLRAHRPRARFFIFTDDCQWVRESLLPIMNGTLVETDGEASDVEDLWLMSKCRHFIIANSTFSWWGAWLSTWNDKRVIAPMAGWGGEGGGTKGFLPAQWETL
jgi:hypothetical protein